MNFRHIVKRIDYMCTAHLLYCVSILLDIHSKESKINGIS